MGRYHKACVAIAATISLLAGSVWGTGTGFAKEIDPNDPEYNTPGFPLPTVEDNENDSPLTGGRIDWGITDDTPAPFTVLNYGGLPLPIDNFVNIGVTDSKARLRTYRGGEADGVVETGFS